LIVDTIDCCIIYPWSIINITRYHGLDTNYSASIDRRWQDALCSISMFLLSMTSQQRIALSDDNAIQNCGSDHFFETHRKENITIITRSRLCFIHIIILYKYNTDAADVAPAKFIPTLWFPSLYRGRGVKVYTTVTVSEFMLQWLSWRLIGEKFVRPFLETSRASFLRIIHICRAV